MSVSAKSHRNPPVVGLRSARRLIGSHHEWKRRAPQSIKRGIERKVRQSARHDSLVNEMLAWAQDDLAEQQEAEDRASYLDFLEECRAYDERRREEDAELESRYEQDYGDFFDEEVLLIGCCIEDRLAALRLELEPHTFAILDQPEGDVNNWIW
jgi:hypothetical protein